jgi:putative spermidine/putrescine transport system ATP-binding protein
MSEPSVPEVVLDHLTRTYGSTVAVDDLSLAIGRGELVSLLGPSGCGKTTTLRMLGGFIAPTRGRVLIRGKDVTHDPPYRRDTGMVFQNYALFPHLTVFENLAFGLRRRRLPRPEVAKRVDAMLELLQLGELAGRYPRQLSGGQQQRVAVGRALVVNPAVILLDEPFSNLDAKLRESTRIEMRRLQQELQLTAVFVTHDQEEAMAISDRIVVMNRGRVEQVGTAQEIYERPGTSFVAAFIGAANVLRGRVTEAGSAGVRAETDTGLDLLGDASSGLAAGDIVTAIMRPESIRVSGQASPAPNAASGRVVVASFLGAQSQLTVRLPGGGTLLARGERSLAALYPVGSEVSLAWDPDAVYLFTS